MKLQIFQLREVSQVEHLNIVVCQIECGKFLRIAEIYRIVTQLITSQCQLLQRSMIFQLYCRQLLFGTRKLLQLSINLNGLSHHLMLFLQQIGHIRRVHLI